jgi:ribosomal-protein-alanine N-acetyltransferase
MSHLQRLDAGRELDVLAFELGNRAYFSRFISDRGDAFFEHFAERYAALLAEQAEGVCAFYGLLGENEAMLGRFNLYDLKDGSADVGYRVGERYAGAGLATAAVRDLCGLAATEHGLRTLRAATSHANIASQRVLTKAGFLPVGPATPADLGGKTGTWYQRDLTLG